MIDSAVVQCGFTSLRSKFHLPLGLLYPIAYLGEAFTALTGRFVKLTPFTIRMLGAQSPLRLPHLALVAPGLLRECPLLPALLAPPPARLCRSAPVLRRCPPPSPRPPLQSQLLTLAARAVIH
eukprot:COSAG04_NODE_18183_length_449_cov_0.648571_1_plen_122_part_01